MYLAYSLLVSKFRFLSSVHLSYVHIHVYTFNIAFCDIKIYRGNTAELYNIKSELALDSLLKMAQS